MLQDTHMSIWQPLFVPVETPCSTHVPAMLTHFGMPVPFYFTANGLHFLFLLSEPLSPS